MECYWIRNTEKTLTELRKASGSVAMIPLASIESHGPHLPLGTDTYNIDHVVDIVVQTETVAVLPTIQYSWVGSARALPGAINIPSALLMDMVENVCDEIHRNGFNKVVLLHGHGGNVFLDAAFIRRMQEREKAYAIYSIPPQPGISEDIKALMESEHIGHACEFETSMNMVCSPDLVNMKALDDKTFPPQTHPQIGFASAPILYIAHYPEMAVGEPQKATREKGEKIVKLYCDAVIEHLRLIKADQICPHVMADYIRRANSIAEDKS